MLRAFSLTASSFLIAAASVTFLACSSSSSKPHGLSSAQTGGSGARGGSSAGGSSTGGSSTGGTGASSSGGSISVSGGASGSGTGGTTSECGGEDHAAELLPLDLYLMLDSSGSMLGEANGTTKWAAIQSALQGFLNDPASAGIGIGLQFFPLESPDAPESCQSNADCGTFGPCLQKFCQGAGPDFYWCDSNAECITTDNVDLGPCTPLTYCWSQLSASNPVPSLCHNDADCGMVDDCVTFNECSGNTDYGCKEVGTPCQTAAGANYGTCRRFDPLSLCAHTTDCRVTTYATPAAEIAVLPGAAPALGSVITAKVPDGNTPSAPALEGAIAHARTWASSHPDHKVAVLLATDGLPTECIADPAGDPGGISGVTAVAAAGLSSSPSISTFVIGVFSPEDRQDGADDNLNQIARAGGSDQAFIVETSGDVEQDFRDALDEIRGTRLPCEFQIPKGNGNSPAYDQVNVVFTTGGEPTVLYYWPSENECDPTSGGWYYDVDPQAGIPTKIIACPVSCGEFQNASDGRVSIRLGCATVVK
jgi:hypothetical protein